MKNDDMYNELHSADILRSLTAAATALELEETTIDDFCNYLECLCEVADGVLSHNDFIKKVNIKDIVYT